MANTPAKSYIGPQPEGFDPGDSVEAAMVLHAIRPDALSDPAARPAIRAVMSGCGVMAVETICNGVEGINRTYGAAPVLEVGALATQAA